MAIRKRGKVLQVVVSLDVDRRLRAIAERERTTMPMVVRELIAAQLDARERRSIRAANELAQ